MRSGVPILGTRTLPCLVQQEGKNHFRIKLVQGLNRQIRRMCHYLGYEVVRLQRVRIMNISLGKLPVGRWRLITPDEISVLQQMVATSVKTQEA
jgi:23S rRNA pseudouridine2604 synthase